MTVIGKPFAPGQSGNPGGRPKTRPFKDALKKLIDESGVDGDNLRLIAQALITKASAGDVQAIKEIGDRLDGKVPQSIVGDDDEDPINVLHRIERVIVSPKNSNG